MSSQRICRGPCPAKQPGHQCKEASEGHAPAPLKARTHSTGAVLKVTYTGCGQGSAPRTHCGATPCQTEPVETARSWPDRRPRTGGALQRAMAPGSPCMEWLGDRGLLKETGNTLPAVGQEHRVLDTGQVPADSPEHNRRATLSSQLPTHFCSQLCAITLMWLEAPEPSNTASPHQGYEAAVTNMESGINSPHRLGDEICQCRTLSQLLTTA